MNQIIQELKQAHIEDIRPNEPMSRHTTWKVGGPADLLIYPKTKAELQAAMMIIYRHQLSWHVVGRGSNLLVRDGGLRGVVFRLDEGFDDMEIKDTRVTVGGGYSIVRLSNKISRMGLSGLEFAGGIPGTVGGAVYMNAGAHGSEVREVLESAEILLETGEWTRLTNEEMGFSYRTSILQTELPGIVTEATFQTKPGDRDEIGAAMAQYKDRRRMTQPLQYPCAGSVFRNPPGDHAGRLIEASGLKGYRIGDAEVSTLHANFIINRGQASANNVLTLIDHIIQTVEEQFGVSLHPEVLVVGEE
ncbi:UDP-N-acetylmuramate dehydrogenase [Mechercharimyces sp. CAU 1602]|uniref:UDP-N-acetylmuramate dehydrogenase n=1 Tax=Mechercharimyces sp. CAU 1602 TaxID=2973933 RepID=UPI0021621F7A|nr:UDP-N-acetylmuramate dehydrogenase [Mechercharimyces sp. CAU 1602]MCS1350625.1 UDP-N-acetylmuramate dehydrogenase [Mechercharimyces sp. CAU 1602]